MKEALLSKTHRYRPNDQGSHAEDKQSRRCCGAPEKENRSFCNGLSFGVICGKQRRGEGNNSEKRFSKCHDPQ